MSFLKPIKQGKHIYLAEVKSVREGKKVRHKFIRYVGKKVDNKTILSGSIDRAEVTKVSVYGPLLVLNDIADRLGLKQIFGEEAPYVLSLAFAHCIEPGSMASIKKWYGRTDLNHILSLENVTYDKLLDAMDALHSEQKLIQRKMFRSAQEAFGLKPKGLFYDVTNVYFYGCKCPLAKRGYNKGKSRKKQVQIGLAVTKDEKIPLFHQVFEGNIHDARTLQDVFDEFDAQFVKKACIVWDRGVTSRDNIIAAKKAKFDVICGLPLKGKAKSAAEAILASQKLVRFENRIALTKSTLFAIHTRYRYEDIPGYLTVCFNEKEKAALREARYRKIHEALEKVKKKQPVSAGVKKYIRYNKVNKKELEKAEQFDGVSAIFSTRKLSPHETVRVYFERDTIEKAFRSLKTTLEIQPIRHWLAERVESHIFICYIAYYLLSILEYQMLPLNMTATHALDQLKTMYRVHLTDPKTKNNFIKTVMLTKEQEKILKTVNKKLTKM